MLLFILCKLNAYVQKHIPITFVLLLGLILAFNICLITVILFSNTTSVLGQTFGMLIIQDFEAVTPNNLARIIECVEGGGLIAIMMSSAQTLQEVASLKMVIYEDLLIL